MFERFTEAARDTVMASVEQVSADGGQQVQPVHLLLALTVGPDDIGARVLAAHGLDPRTLARALDQADEGPRPAIELTDEESAALRAVGIDPDEVRRRIEAAFGDEEWLRQPQAGPAKSAPQRPTAWWPGGKRPRLTPEAKQVLGHAVREAARLRHRHIGTGHLLLGLLTRPDPALAEVFTAHGLTLDGARAQVRSLLAEAA